MEPAFKSHFYQNKKVWLLSLTILLLLCLFMYELFSFTTAPRVAMVPLDSRPVNTDLPQQLAAIGGIQVDLPEADLLDQFLTPSDQKGLFNWLQQQESADIMIIHLNELLFGGLINSRIVDQYADSPAKLQLLENFLQQKSSDKTNIQLIYILPRLLVSQYDLTMWEYEKELAQYSQLKHRQALEPQQTDITDQLVQLQKIIPMDILKHYEQLYSQAALVGQQLLTWTEQGLITEAIIGLDDAAPYGLNVQVYQDLQTTARQRQLNSAYFLHGADELAPLIIARNTLNLPEPDTVEATFLSPGDEQKIFPYEAISLQENFQEKTAFLFAPKVNDDSWKVSIWPFKQQANISKKRLYFNTDQAMSPADMAQAWQLMARDDSLIGLVDAAKTNGAFRPFIDHVGVDQIYQYVDAYAGWNTAGNSLGTVLAQLLFWERGQGLQPLTQKKATASHQQLQTLRIIDDYFYQSQVRDKLVPLLLEKGFPYLSFGERWPEANTLLQVMMAEALAAYPELLTDEQIATYQFAFPWPRTFEIRINKAL